MSLWREHKKCCHKWNGIMLFCQNFPQTPWDQINFPCRSTTEHCLFTSTISLINDSYICVLIVTMYVPILQDKNNLYDYWLPLFCQVPWWNGMQCC